MSEPLGKIEKPEAETFQSKRKLYLVTLIFAEENAPQEYVERFNRYWEEAREHIANLESRIGVVNCIYHEFISLSGENGLLSLEQLNPASCGLVKGKVDSGAVLEAVEDKELANEALDWERFLLTGFMSQKVAKMVTEFYFQALKKRYEHISRVIDQTLKANAAGLLFIREGHLVQFPKDVEVFFVAPPALDEIRRWQQSRQSRQKE